LRWFDVLAQLWLLFQSGCFNSAVYSALRFYFVEHCSLESAAPTVLDSDRVADPSTLRRWFRGLDSSQTSFSFLRKTLDATDQFLARGEIIHHDALPLSWPTLAAFLQLLWPLRL